MGAYCTIISISFSVYMKLSTIKIGNGRKNSAENRIKTKASVGFKFCWLALLTVLRIYYVFQARLRHRKHSIVFDV